MIRSGRSFSGKVCLRGFHSDRCLKQKAGDVQDDELQKELAKLYESPLFKQSHKWDGSTKKLSQSSIPKKLNLRDNPFARILSSPARQDRTSKLVLPRDVMLRLSIAKDEDDGSLWLIPNLENKHMNSESSYYALDRGLIEQQFKKRPGSFAPLEVLTSSTKITSPADIKYNKTTDLLINRELIKFLEEALTSLEELGATEAEQNDLVIHLKDEVTHGLNVDNDGIIHLSPASFKIPSPNYNDFIQKLEDISTKYGKVIIKSVNREFIDTFMRLVLYNK